MTPENLHTQSSALLVALLHSCGGVLLRTTSRRVYTEMHPSWLKVASSKRLKQMRDITYMLQFSSCAVLEREAYARQYRRLTEQPPVDMKETYGWLKAANLPAATEALVVAAQDQALWTQYYERKILHRDVGRTCRTCSVALETVDHIVAGCSALAPMDYTKWHNQVASIIHWDVCRHFGVPVESRWYRHHPDRLVETNDITMMWDTTIPTAKKIKANRPDILLMATLARNMLRSWRSTATCEWR